MNNYLIVTVLCVAIVTIVVPLLSFAFYKTHKRQLDAMFYRLRSEVSDKVNKRLNTIEEYTRNIENRLETRATEIKRLNDEISLLSSVADSLPVPYWIKDLDRRMLYTNPCFERVFLKDMGLTSRDYKGKKDADIFGIENSVVFAIGDNYVLDGKGIYKEYETLNHDDVELKLLVMKFPVYEKGHLKGVAGIILSGLENV